MDNKGAAAREAPQAGAGSMEAKPKSLAEKLAEMIDCEARYKKADNEAKKEKATLDVLKTDLMDEFEELGVTSMNAKGKTIYVHRQIWAGVADGKEKISVVKELQDLGLADFVTFNSQALSGYVRETAKEHSDLVDAKGDLVGDPAQILAVLPGELSRLCKVSETLDLRIRKAS